MNHALSTCQREQSTIEPILPHCNDSDRQLRGVFLPPMEVTKLLTFVCSKIGKFWDEQFLKFKDFQQMGSFKPWEVSASRLFRCPKTMLRHLLLFHHFSCPPPSLHNTFGAGPPQNNEDKGFAVQTSIYNERLHENHENFMGEVHFVRSLCT